MKWKEVPNTDGRYLVSDTGKVFSAVSNKILRTTRNDSGYERVEFNIDGVAKKESVHRLVALAFVPNPNNYPVVNHKDENPRNNCADNLEWCTYKYNSNYGTCIDKRVANTKYKIGSENPRSKEVYQFDLDGNLIGHYDSARQAALALGLDRKSISKVRTGKLKQYAGFVWCETNEFRKPSKKKHFVAGAVLQYDMDGNFIRRYEKPKFVAEYGFDPNAVRDVCRNVKGSHKGFLFKYE